MPDDKHKIQVRINQPSPDTTPKLVTHTVIEQSKADQASITADPPAIDIFAATKTAPPLPTSAQKQRDLVQPDKTVYNPKPQLIDSTANTPPLVVSIPQPITPPAAADSVGALASTYRTKASDLDDETTDAAVDQIVANESDEVLAAEDALAAAQSPLAKQGSSHGSKLRCLIKSKWTWITILLLLLVIAGIPQTRYKLLGLVVKKSISISVVDSMTGSPVSAASVSADGTQALSNAQGRITLRLPVGRTMLSISKHYYTEERQTAFIGFGSEVKLRVKLVATGRQIPITVSDAISSAPLSGVTISALGSKAITNAAGHATLVVPAHSASANASLVHTGYNSASVSVAVTNAAVLANEFMLTPSGKVYVLSKTASTIDVVKTNLDGSNRQTVLSGTGQEDPNNTKLLTSSDGQYLVLESKRSGQTDLFVINTTTDALTEFDSSASQFNLIGWSGDNFIYDEISSATPNSSAGHELIRSYNAASSELNQLDENQVQGSGSTYAYQSFDNFTLLPNLLTYTTQWNAVGNADLSNDSDTIRTIEPTGQDKKDDQSFTSSSISSLQAVQYQPESVYYAAVNTNGTTNYYQYANGTVSQTDNSVSVQFTLTNLPYFYSPSSLKALWNQPNGSDLLLGDVGDQSQKALSIPAGYQAYGWYGNNYLLVTKDDTLYIVPLSGTQTPQKLVSFYALSQGGVSSGYQQLL